MESAEAEAPVTEYLNWTNVVSQETELLNLCIPPGSIPETQRAPFSTAIKILFTQFARP